MSITFSVVFVVALIALLSILSMFLLWREWDRREKEITELTKRVKALESSGQLRLPHQAADELLNAMAVLDVELSKRQIEMDYLKNIQGHITNAMSVGTKRQNKEK
jgi:hypothetical protein